MDKLLPCPFCGGEAWISHVWSCDSEKRWYQVGCTLCGIGLLTRTKTIEKEAIAAWNRRAQPENKPLTCDGCALHYEGAERDEPCLSCKRKSRADYYRSKPEEANER